MKKNHHPKCPRCYTNKSVNYNGNSSAWGTSGPEINDGGSLTPYYCKNCFTEFTIKIEYKRHLTDITKVTGWTGLQG